MPAEQTPFIETEPVRVSRVSFHQNQLPLAGDRSCITGTPQHLGDGILLLSLGERTPAGFQPKRILAGEQSQAGWMADRHAVTVVESHAAPSQRVDVGGLPALSAVSSDWLTTDIIGKDQDNIRFNRCG